MFDKIKKFLIGKLDVDGNGKVRLADAEAKFGQAVVRAFLVGGGLGIFIGLVASRLVK